MRPILRNNQRGFAMFVALMALTLGTSFAFLAFQVSTTDLAISRYTASEASAQYLAESGIEKVLSWASTPDESPSVPFFRSLTTNPSPCLGDQEKPDFFIDAQVLSNPDGYFSELNNMGKITDIRLYNVEKNNGICTVEVSAETPQGGKAAVRVNIVRNPLGSITAGIQGAGNSTSPSPIWVHWGDIRYAGDANIGNDIKVIPEQDSATFITPDSYKDTLIDPLMDLLVQGKIVGSPPPDDLNDENTYILRPNVRQNEGSTADLDNIFDPHNIGRLQSFIKKHGEYYTLVIDKQDGSQHLLRNGKHLIEGDTHVDSFDAIFDGATETYHLVWIDNGNISEPLEIYGGRFKGSFYFSGDISIVANSEETLRLEPVDALSPSIPGHTRGEKVTLSDINLEGLFAAKQEINIERQFKVYGAMYSGAGFTSTAQKSAIDLEVWYNTQFANGTYPGVRYLTPLAGTWMSVERADE